MNILYNQVISDTKTLKEDTEAGLYKGNPEEFNKARNRIDAKLSILEAEAEERKEDERFDFHPLQGEVA